MNMAEFAAKIGTEVGNLSRLERGLQFISGDTLKQVSRELRVPIWRLFYLAEENRREVPKRVQTLVERIENLAIENRISNADIALLTSLVSRLEKDTPAG